MRRVSAELIIVAVFFLFSSSGVSTQRDVAMEVTHEGQSGKEQSELKTHQEKKRKGKKNSKQLQRSLCSGRREEEEKGVWVFTAPLKSVCRVRTGGEGNRTQAFVFFLSLH